MATLIAQVNVACEYCGKGTQFYCRDCDANMCGWCIRKHISITTDDEHTLVKYSKKNAIDLENVCKLHNMQKVVFYCNQCLEPVCSKCVTGPHTSHPFDELFNATHLKQIEIKKDTLELETMIKSQYEEKLSHAVEEKSSRLMKYDKINRINEKQGDIVKDQIDKVIKEYKCKSDVMKNKESRVFEEYQSKLQEFFDDAKERIRENKEILDSRDSNEICCYTSENEKFRIIPELPQFTDTEFEPCTVGELLAKVTETYLTKASFSTRTLLVAIHPLKSNDEHYLSFSEGDHFEVDSNYSFQEEDKQFYVKHVVTGEHGYVPNDYVKIYTGEDSSEDPKDAQYPPWWFIGSKDGAEKQLLITDLRNGTFLVRESTDQICYFLSIRMSEHMDKTASVKHYRVCKIDGEVFIPSRKHFPSLDEMIKHYQSTKDDICCQLTDPYTIILQSIPDSCQEISREDIKIGKHLAIGTLGNIFSGKLSSSKSVAVKACSSDERENIGNFFKEAGNLKSLGNARILQLYGVCTQSTPKLILTELMENGSLLQCLKKDKGASMSIGDITHLASEIAEGMVFIESKGYVHRNLRAENILLGKANTVKISGLRLAIHKDTEHEDSYEIVCSREALEWDALEVITNGTYSSKSDVWSFGVMLYEMVTFGKRPYEGMNDVAIIEYLKKGHRLQKPPECPDGIYEIMTKCWSIDACNRYTFEYLSSYFDNYAVTCEKHYETIEH